MFRRALESTPPPYPLVQDLGLDVVRVQQYPWGTIRFTENAVTAYELEFRELTADEPQPKPPVEGFDTDILIAGPFELSNIPHYIPAVGGIAMYRGGARVTVGLKTGREQFGLNFTAQTFDSLTQHLHKERVSEFNKGYGDDILDWTQARYTHVMAHTLTNLSVQWSSHGYLTHKTAEDTRGILRSLNKTNLLMFAGVLTWNAVDFAGDRDIEPVTGGVNIAMLAAMALSAKAHLGAELNAVHVRHHENEQAAGRLAIRIGEDIHSLICPGKDTLAEYRSQV